MGLTWITLYPLLYSEERARLVKHYPNLQVDKKALQDGCLVLYGELLIRPPEGVMHYPIRLRYPDAFPYEHPTITPIEQLPQWDDAGCIVDSSAIKEKWFDHRHQMPLGNLCLFQRDTKITGGDTLTCLGVIKRAEQWFRGLHTGQWPPDTAESEMESHFCYLTDVLLPEQCFADDLNGQGRILFVHDYSRTVEQEHDCIDFSPLIATCLTKEGSIIQPVDCSGEIRKLYPWIDNVAWDANKFASAKDISSEMPPNLHKYITHGYWWEIPSEPSPFHDSGGFIHELASAFQSEEEAWAAVDHVAGADLQSSDHVVLGLRYPARNTGFEWLFVVLIGELPKHKTGAATIITKKHRQQHFNQMSPYVLRTHRIESHSLELRNTGVIGEGVKTKTVAMLGLGALGSKVAEMLAQAGIGTFKLWDLDRLETANVSRHIAGVTDFGARKTWAVYSRLRNINPFIKIPNNGMYNQSVTESLDKLQEFIKGVDLVISTLADESAESVVNQIALIEPTPVLYGRSLRKGNLGRVFLVRPGEDPCKSCLASYASSDGDTPEDWINIPEDPDEIVYHECGRPVIAGSAVDLSFTASLIARRAIDYLEGMQVEANHTIWCNRPEPAINPKLDQPLSTLSVTLPRLEDCPVCREPEVVEVVVSENIFNFIQGEALASLDAETGGLLLGYVDSKNRAVITKATGPGPNAERSRTIFRRDVEYCQQQLKIAEDDLGNQGVYVGEWHSHLVSKPVPSPTDISSLTGIAEAPNYATSCPCMVILGVDVEKQSLGDYGAWVFPISGRMYKVPCKLE